MPSILTSSCFDILRSPFPSRGYFAASSGNVTDEVIMKYIEQQGMEPPDGDFKIDGDNLYSA